MPTVHLLDYVAGNIRSLVNAINQVGYDVEWVKTPEDVKNADVSQIPQTNSTMAGSRSCHR
jgi:glutamine amidotransferase/cyclase